MIVGGRTDENRSPNIGKRGKNFCQGSLADKMFSELFQIKTNVHFKKLR